MNTTKTFRHIVLLLGISLFSLPAAAGQATIPDARQAKATIALKTPGNPAKDYRLIDNGGTLKASENLPVEISRHVTTVNDGAQRITVTLKALDNIYFNYGEQLGTEYRHDDCQFYMPGFWYRRNLRSPKEAPSFHTSDSWLVREDRLSTPLTAIFNNAKGQALSIARLDDFKRGDALTTHKEGEVILSGNTSVGYTGFQNVGGTATLAYGFPYREEPRTYIRKLTLAPAVEAFQAMRKGESLTLTWELKSTPADDFSSCVQKIWEYSYDTYRPQPVNTPYTVDFMKKTMSNYFRESFVRDTLCFYSSPRMMVATCASVKVAEIGFVGRTLLNAFNALEYAEATNDTSLASDARSIFDSYLQAGFTPSGLFREVVELDNKTEERNLSIRRQSEGVYAILHYLNYEKQHKRRHPEWEKHVRAILDIFVKLQNQDGSLPRKFKADFTIVDPTGGSTPSATLPLVMGYKYFKDKRYLTAAKRTVDYLEKEIISKADYFSSTLDANCEDKEASLYAATAAYYTALATKGKERAHYAELAKKAAYFALSWYYTWDVPFAQGQMIGDLDMKTRGWGNVSVENNHIDVFIFDFADVLHFLAKEYNEPRFSNFAEVISTSMRQLLPLEGHLCGVPKVGYYPEVVQHTNWDYGRNGKGFYNDIFAPGWTVASLWELFSPGRAERFFGK